MSLIEFNITKWTQVEATKEKKLSKKKRKICRIFNIPVPPRRYLITADVEVDAPKGAVVYNDVILIPHENLDLKYAVMRPPEGNTYRISNIDPQWFPVSYTGKAIIIYHGFFERS